MILAAREFEKYSKDFPTNGNWIKFWFISYIKRSLRSFSDTV